MNKIVLVVFVILQSAFLACGNGKGRQVAEPYDGGHGIGIDTATIHQLDLIEDSTPVTKEVVPVKTTPKAEVSSSYRHKEKEPDNMRGFDPASEDDMDDNGMSRYMENNDEEGWD
jgi:hypothetical protein